MMDKQEERLKAAAAIMALGVLRLLEQSFDPSKNREGNEPGDEKTEKSKGTQTG